MKFNVGAFPKQSFQDINGSEAQAIAESGLAKNLRAVIVLDGRLGVGYDPLTPKEKAALKDVLKDNRLNVTDTAVFVR